jgi:uroporphyrinogen-III synthase
MAARIALFRAHEDAAGSARRLHQLGFSVARLPVIEIAPLAFQPARTRYDAVIATSAKAFLGDAPADKASLLFVVGAKTARGAELHGWRLAAPPSPDVDRLIETLERETRPGASLLYLAGRDRKGALEAAFSGTRDLEVVQTYAAEARKEWSPGEVKAFGSCTAALHYSRRSARLAARLAEAAGFSQRFVSLPHVCLSREVAEALEAIGATDLFVSPTPDETALLKTLSHALRGISFG